MPRDQRRLAAIVSADVAGYSRLMGRDEGGTLAALKAHRRELIDSKIAEYGGRIVKTTGDGLLLDFPSVVDAVRCAVDVQRGMTERNADASDKRIDFRIGINVGDIIIDGEDIFGDGVNVAARLQALAEPGGICVSKVVRDQVLDKLSFDFEELGAQHVKNIARPVEVFRVHFANASRSRPIVTKWWKIVPLPNRRRLAAGMIAIGLVGVTAWSLSVFLKPSSTAAPPPMSVAILPFVTAAGDASERQLADTLVRDLSSAVEKSRVVLVSSPARTATYRDKVVDVRTVGRDLDVRYVVEGEFRRLGDLRIVDAKLIDAGSGIQNWSDHLQIQESSVERNRGTLVLQLASRLSDALWQAEVHRSRSEPRAGAGAMDLFLHGWAVWAADDNTLSGALEARKWFDRSLRMDPAFAPALIARVRTLQYEYDLAPRPERDHLIAEMDHLTFRAVGVDPDYATAWRWRAEALMLQWRWDAALEAVAKAERLNPARDEASLNLRAGLLILRGRPADALTLIDQQLALDPQAKESLGWAALQRCRAYMALGRYTDAVAACEKDIALDNWWLAHAYLLAGYGQLGEAAKITAEKAALLKLRPGFSIADFKGMRFSDDPTFWRQTETHVFAGWHKAGIPEQ